MQKNQFNAQLVQNGPIGLMNWKGLKWIEINQVNQLVQSGSKQTKLDWIGTKWSEMLPTTSSLKKLH